MKYFRTVLFFILFLRTFASLALDLEVLAARDYCLYEGILEDFGVQEFDNDSRFRDAEDTAIKLTMARLSGNGEIELAQDLEKLVNDLVSHYGKGEQQKKMTKLMKYLAYLMKETEFFYQSPPPLPVYERSFSLISKL